MVYVIFSKLPVNGLNSSTVQLIGQPKQESRDVSSHLGPGGPISVGVLFDVFHLGLLGCRHLKR
ncbi:hypothetical protein CsSME_00032012 [Camellia sinensis var. sinensis]